ncbi:YpmA family protein [Paenalkalicoccus suaedae]|uniref:YpmA family protein n=1 Tax=Paenalkalicoccus suaedae TaxID=2592382 RepID=A0A859FFW9_9BACI|nr:YpmA family protein [Paenalkalicoccus suaedae]QKS71126.1 YpmA family protein [Paenalkalicoccus suaedae]
MENDKIRLLSTVKVAKHEDTYKLVDALNRTLKDRDLMFGLSLDEKDKDQMIFSIYET